MKMQRKSRFASGFLAVVMLVISLGALCSCATEPPLLEDVREEYIALIEASAEINAFLFGAGLPVYERDGSEESATVYDGMIETLDNYEFVREESKYLSISAMKEAAERVYSADYLESAYMMAFDGYSDEIAGVTTARYIEWDGWLYKSISYEPLISETRTFNYDTMKIVKPSRGEYVNVSIESSLGAEKLVITLAFTLTENGWRLDTPTY